MSKEPQVGDVWRYRFNEYETIYHISAIAEYKCPEYYLFVLFKNGYGEVIGYWIDEKKWQTMLLGNMKYLGKSKASIGDLFKTENEE